MDITNIVVGQRIKKLRLELGESMEQFGKRFNTSKGTVNNWEKGRNFPNKQNLLKLAQLAETSVEDFMFSIPQDIKDNTFNEILNNKILDGEEKTYIKKHFADFKSGPDFDRNSIAWETNLSVLKDNYRNKCFIENHTVTEILDYISTNLSKDFLSTLIFLGDALYEHDLKSKILTDSEKKHFIDLMLKIDMYKRMLSIQFELLEKKTPEIKRKP